MRELKEVLKESFYSNVGIDNCIANAITSGREKIIKHGINPAGRDMQHVTAKITKTSLTSIHVEVKGYRLLKLEFDIDFTKHEDKLREIARGKFSDLQFCWIVGYYSRDEREFRETFTMRFTNPNTYQDYFLNYNIDNDTLTEATILI